MIATQISYLSIALAVCNITELSTKQFAELSVTTMTKHCYKEENPVLIPNFSCHNLRHTFATRLCEADINLSVIQNVMGHKEIKTTLEIYTHVTEAKKREEVDILETRFAWT